MKKSEAERILAERGDLKSQVLNRIQHHMNHLNRLMEEAEKLGVKVKPKVAMTGVTFEITIKAE